MIRTRSHRQFDNQASYFREHGCLREEKIYLRQYHHRLFRNFKFVDFITFSRFSKDTRVTSLACCLSQRSHVISVKYFSFSFHMHRNWQNRFIPQDIFDEYIIGYFFNELNFSWLFSAQTSMELTITECQNSLEFKSIGRHVAATHSTLKIQVNYPEIQWLNKSNILVNQIYFKQYKL